MNDNVCECGHAKADHLNGVGCCVGTSERDEMVTDETVEVSCGCGVFRPDDADVPHEWMVQITTPDGRGTFRVRAAPDASPELREALFNIAQEAYRRLDLGTKKGPRR